MQEMHSPNKRPSPITSRQTSPNRINSLTSQPHRTETKFEPHSSQQRSPHCAPFSQLVYPQPSTCIHNIYNSQIHIGSILHKIDPLAAGRDRMDPEFRKIPESSGHRTLENHFPKPYRYPDPLKPAEAGTMFRGCAAKEAPRTCIMTTVPS